MEEFNREFDDLDYDSDDQSGGAPKRIKKVDRPPIRQKNMDIPNVDDPIIRKLINKMEYEKFMPEEDDINIRFELYKQKFYNNNKNDTNI